MKCPSKRLHFPIMFIRCQSMVYKLSLNLIGSLLLYSEHMRTAHIVLIYLLWHIRRIRQQTVQYGSSPVVDSVWSGSTTLLLRDCSFEIREGGGLDSLGLVVCEILCPPLIPVCFFLTPLCLLLEKSWPPPNIFLTIWKKT